MPLGQKTLLSRVTSVFLSCSFILGVMLLVNAYYLKQSFASKMMSYNTEIERQKIYIKALLQKTEETILETQVTLQQIEPVLVEEASRGLSQGDKKERRLIVIARKSKDGESEIEHQIYKTVSLVKKARALQKKWTEHEEDSNPYANAP